MRITRYVLRNQPPDARILWRRLRLGGTHSTSGGVAGVFFGARYFGARYFGKRLFG